MAIILSQPSVYTFAKPRMKNALAYFERLGLQIKYSRGEQYLGGFVGSAKEKEKWIKGKVEG